MKRKHYELYRDSNRGWRWRLKASNGLTIADSAESYRNRGDCLKALKLVKHSASAPVVEL